MYYNPLSPQSEDLRRRLFQSIWGALLGAQVGDALGLPVECSDRDSILKLSGGKVRQFYSPLELRGDDGWGPYGGPGSTSDDFQLFVAMMEAMTEIAHGTHLFDLAAVARALVRAKNTSTAGWGPSTKLGVIQLEEDLKVRDPHEWFSLLPVQPTANAKGRGNGAAMRVGPVVFAAHLLDWLPEQIRAEDQAEHLVWLCFRQAWLTHADPVAWVGTLLFARRLHLELTERKQGKPPLPPTGLGRDIEAIKACWQPAARAFLETDQLLALETDPLLASYIPAVDEAFATCLKPLERLAQIDFRKAPIEQIIEITGNGGVSEMSIPLSLAIFHRHPDDPEAAICEAVECGGDTDSNAAQVGVLVGARNGPHAFPAWMRQYEADVPRALTEAFLEACGF